MAVVDLTEDKGVHITSFNGCLKDELLDFVFELRASITQRSVIIPKIHSNTLWQVGWIFSSEERTHPNWSGYMQNIKADELMKL